MRRTRAGLAAVLLLGLGGCGGSSATDSPTPLPSPTPPVASCSASPVAGTPPLRTERVAAGFDAPLDLQTPGDKGRLFVVEQAGRIRILQGSSILPAAFLDLRGRVSGGSEQGLLGLAFHPGFAQNGRFFVNYTDLQGDTHIAEFRGTSDLADPASERTLLFVRQPFENHNGGGLVFGADGLLYVGLGDGGSAGDPFANAQTLSTPLGKLLRIDVDGAAPFAVPAGNPFLASPGAVPAIWAYGLRNPWRFAFDRATGDLYIGDVGQNEVEEIDVELAPRRGGQNYGWNITEGTECFKPSVGCVRDGLTLPILEYHHDEGCAVTGGGVYRGCRMPGYAGTYFYGDFCSAFIRSFRLVNGQAAEQRDWTAALGPGIDRITSFGTDAEGEVYVVDQDGEIYKIVPAS